MLYHMLRLLGVSSAHTIERNGMRYQVDLAEGIDLSLFLFGHFQKHVTHNNLFNLPQNVWHWMLVPTLGPPVCLW